MGFSITAVSDAVDQDIESQIIEILIKEFFKLLILFCLDEDSIFKILIRTIFLRMYNV